MATRSANIREIRRTIFGRDMREPIADALESFTPAGDSHDIDEVTNFRNEKLQELRDTVPTLTAAEQKHAQRVESITTLEQQKEIEWIETITHIVHDPPTIYSLNGNNNISATLISDSDYLLNDAGSSTAVISDDEFLMTAGSNYATEALDDPTHEEYEYVIHWVPDFTLIFKRVNET